jgi:uncharacterized membrane protein YdfJ with MMPL/SSD domain
MCKINKFFEDRNNLIIVLVSIGIIIILIILIFFYSFRNRSSDKIRIFQEQQKTFGGISPQFSPIQIKPVQPVIQQAKPAPQPKQNDAAARQKAAAINAARLSLRNYILKEMKKGISEKDIKDVLSKANWKEAEISTAMQDVKKFVDRKR